MKQRRNASYIHESVRAESIRVEVDEVRVGIVGLVSHQADAPRRVLGALLLGAGVALAVWI
jgi:hypothetical protein